MVENQNNAVVESNNITVSDFVDNSQKIFSVFGFELNDEHQKHEPLTRSKRVKRFLKNFYFCFNLISGFMLSSICVIETVMLIKQKKETYEVLELTLFAIYNSSAIIRTLIIYFNKQKIIELTDKLSEIFPTTQVEQKKYSVKKIQRRYSIWSKVYITLLLLAILLFVVEAICSSMLYGPIKFPFNSLILSYLRSNFAKTLIIIWIGYSILVVSAFYVANDFLLPKIAIIFDLECRILKNDYKDAFASSKLKMEELKILIDRQNAMIGLSNMIQDAFSLKFLYEFLQSSLLICITCVCIVEKGAASAISNIGDLIGKLIHTFLPFYFGQRIFDSSTAIGDIVYDSNWFEIEDRQIKKCIIIMIQRSQNSKYFSTAGFVTICMENYAKVLMTAHSYYTFLLNIRQ